MRALHPPSDYLTDPSHLNGHTHDSALERCIVSRGIDLRVGAQANDDWQSIHPEPAKQQRSPDRGNALED